MSKVKILSYTPQAYGAHQLGLARVSISDKLTVVAKLCLSKTGNKFISWCSAKIGEDWIDTFSLDSKDADRKLRDEILIALQPYLSQIPEKNDDFIIPEHEASDEPLPF